MPLPRPPKPSRAARERLIELRRRRNPVVLETPDGRIDPYWAPAVKHLTAMVLFKLANRIAVRTGTRP